MAKEYIEERDGNYYVGGTRISLDSIVHAFRRGESAETICQNFELLHLEEVYGAIAYYLANQSDIDAYLMRQTDKWAEGKRYAEPLPVTLRERLTRARDELHTTRRVVKFRFLADADLNRAIVSGVLRREPSLDFLTAQAAGLSGMNDSEVLALAAERQRMSARCRLTSAPSPALESRVLVYSSSHNGSILEWRSTNCCSSGSRRRRRSG